MHLNFELTTVVPKCLTFSYLLFLATREERLMRYRVVSEWGQLKDIMLVRAEFERKINEALVKDWAPQGGVDVSQSSSLSTVVIFSQAMIAND
jgi:hypothetical protein